MAGAASDPDKRAETFMAMADFLIPAYRTVPNFGAVCGWQDAVLPYASVHHLVEAKRISCWSLDPPLTRTLLLATSNQRPMSATTRAMIRTVRKEVRDIISTQPWRPPGASAGRSSQKS